MAAPPCIVWFRNDLRLADNPALIAAASRGGPVVPAFIWSPDEDGEWPPGAASRWWLHHSLQALATSLEKAGSTLLIRKGSALSQLRQLIRESGADAVFWNQRHEPQLVQRDLDVTQALGDAGIHVASYNGALLFEPGALLNKSDKPYRVFTPFWKACRSGPNPAAPRPAPRRLPAPNPWPASRALDDLALLPASDWTAGLSKAWQPGEAGAKKNLALFISRTFATYADGRNRPDQRGTSRLSAHLHFGEISPRQVWHAGGKKDTAARWGGSQFMTEIGWREFAHYLLSHFPHTPEKPLQPKFKAFPWRTDNAQLRAWQRGLTGYPLVDAGMRELWHTGWMHNRVRMVAASFLVKDLLIDWRHGAAWFWDTLVDADLANNTLGWQWVAGCGADAAPYYRVFNPVGQGAKFDPEGHYARRWLPELARLPTKWIHCPFDAPAAVLKKAGIVLGRDYPRPVVMHAWARTRALTAYAEIKANN